MFAVLKTGGKQYIASPGEFIRVEKLDAKTGDKFLFNEILFLGGDPVQIGKPFLEGVVVEGEILDQIKADKVIHFVKRRRKHGSKRTKGHRQRLTVVSITRIIKDGVVIASEEPDLAVDEISDENAETLSAANQDAESMAQDDVNHDGQSATGDEAQEDDNVTEALESENRDEVDDADQSGELEPADEDLGGEQK
ncbi:MAG: 50S ribosomal protein L21 [Roseovarius sp.]|nr:50S ribosomal protein L21 [Roseovarius sp.]MCY4292025.1 50S ribosomal protein L21 [Roseovarius sp.]